MAVHAASAGFVTSEPIGPHDFVRIPRSVEGAGEHSRATRVVSFVRWNIWKFFSNSADFRQKLRRRRVKRDQSKDERFRPDSEPFSVDFACADLVLESGAVFPILPDKKTHREKNRPFVRVPG